MTIAAPVASAAPASPAGFAALRLVVDASVADRWADALLACGALSVDLSDPCAGTPAETPLYGEPGEHSEAAWPRACIEALFAADADALTLLGEAAASLNEVMPECELHRVAAQDWVRETQRQFTPIEVTTGFYIVPSWCMRPAEATLSVTLDPGLAFGTGAHPTTLLCLRWMHQQGVDGARLLDYGCGSGILAIAASKLGASFVRGVDVDPQAIVASDDNARGNGMAAGDFSLPDALDAGGFDVVISNILANPLIVLAPVLSARVRGGGRIALCGILETQQDAVREAYAPWFTLAPWRSADGWVLLHGQRHGPSTRGRSDAGDLR
ncbi:MAG: 50S ribosomal protein L11 methyltransferase [Casimicrobiaceae bacterium]